MSASQIEKPKKKTSVCPAEIEELFEAKAKHVKPPKSKSVVKSKTCEDIDEDEFGDDIDEDDPTYMSEEEEEDEEGCEEDEEEDESQHGAFEDEDEDELGYSTKKPKGPDKKSMNQIFPESRERMNLKDSSSSSLPPLSKSTHELSSSVKSSSSSETRTLGKSTGDVISLLDEETKKPKRKRSHDDDDDEEKKKKKKNKKIVEKKKKTPVEKKKKKKKIEKEVEEEEEEEEEKSVPKSRPKAKRALTVANKTAIFEALLTAGRNKTKALAKGATITRSAIGQICHDLPACESKPITDEILDIMFVGAALRDIDLLSFVNPPAFVEKLCALERTDDARKGMINLMNADPRFRRAIHVLYDMNPAVFGSEAPAYVDTVPKPDVDASESDEEEEEFL